jgi:YfiH family protein
MLIIKPYIFNNFPGILCGFSTKIGLYRNAPYYFNLSFNVNDDPVAVDENRKAFFSSIGLSDRANACQRQVHSDSIRVVTESGEYGESDALITRKMNLGLIIYSADCPAIFLYDRANNIIAAVHSGWRSTAKKILEKTLIRLKEDFGSRGEDLICYIGPSISRQNYEVKKNITENFNAENISFKNGKYYLDLKKASYKMLLDAGVKKNNVQLSKLCTFEYSNLLHSYRRDGEHSGRAIGMIAMKGKI